MVNSCELESIAEKIIKEVLEIPRDRLSSTANKDPGLGESIILEKTRGKYTAVAECFREEPNSDNIKLMVSISGYSFLSGFKPYTKSITINE